MFEEPEEKLETDKLFDLLVENALDFLEHSLDEIESAPKYSVIHFYSAVELLLKARLMAEGWEKVISQNVKNPKWKDFKDGKLKTVGIDEIEKFFNEWESYRDKFKFFKKVAQHRNKMMHFYHVATSEQDELELIRSIVKEQLTAWYMLNKLLDLCDEYFWGWQEKISEINHKLSQNREYLKVIYEDQLPGIRLLKNKGVKVKECPTCKYESVIYEKIYDSFTVGTCAVCNFEEPILTINCPECEFPISFIKEGRGECSECGSIYEPADIVTLFSKDIPRDKEYFESGLPAHCTYCDGYETVIMFEDKYLCVNCFTLFNEYDLIQCNFCGEQNAGELEDSYLLGCVACGGSMDVNMAKD